MAWVFNHGQTITLINKIEIGTDELNQPIYVTVTDIKKGLDKQTKVVDAAKF